MKVLANIDLDDSQVSRIEAVSDAVEVVRADSQGEALELMPEVDVVFGGFDHDMFVRGERLKWVQVTSAGVDGMMYPDFVESDVVLTSAKGIVGVHLADHAMALLLALTRGIAWAIRHPSWDQRAATRDMSWELLGSTMGIVGLGGTGREVAARALGFGMRVIAVDPMDVELPDGVEYCRKMDGLGDLLEASDVVAICAPLTPETEGMFDRAAFSRMQSHAVLVNVTRGSIMDEGALIEALETGFHRWSGPGRGARGADAGRSSAVGVRQRGHHAPFGGRLAPAHRPLSRPLLRQPNQTPGRRTPHQRNRQIQGLLVVLTFRVIPNSARNLRRPPNDYNCRRQAALP